MWVDAIMKSKDSQRYHNYVKDALLAAAVAVEAACPDASSNSCDADDLTE